MIRASSMAQEKKEHLSSHVSGHGSGADVATTEPAESPCEYFGTSLESRISATDLASSVEWAYETAIVGWHL